MRRVLLIIGVSALAAAAPAIAYSDADAGEDTGVVYVADDTTAAVSDADAAAHGSILPHWLYVWKDSEDKYVKKPLTGTPWPTRACTEANEGELVDIWDTYYKAFVTYRCFCYGSGVCGWERVDRYSSAGVWAPTALWASYWVYQGFGAVRDTHRLCASLVCKTIVWANHSYRRKLG